MRIAVISDTHLPRGRAAPARTAASRELRAADLILHAGDIATAAVLDELEALGPPVRAVLGNVDEPALRDRGCPEERVVEAERRADRDGPRRRARPRAASSGCARASPTPTRSSSATRTSRCTRRDGGFQIFNPGSPTDRRRQPRHTMGVAEVGRRPRDASGTSSSIPG